MFHEIQRVESRSGSISYQCLVFNDAMDVVQALGECIDLQTIKEWRYENYPQSVRNYGQRINMIVDVCVGDSVYQDVVVLRYINDVRAACGMPDGECPDWQGPGFIGLCSQGDGGSELVFAWSDINEQKR